MYLKSWKSYFATLIWSNVVAKINALSYVDKMKLKERRPSAAFGGRFITRITDEPSHINAYFNYSGTRITDASNNLCIFTITWTS
jgi:hypothetical protein